MPTRPSSPRQQIVPPERAGARLDVYLAETAPLTRSRAARLVREGRVKVDGHVEKPSARLEAGALVSWILPDPDPTDIQAEAIALDVIWEDEHVAALDKPAGLVVHPGAGNPRGTLVNALVHRWPEIEGVGGTRRPGLVHRLDRDTSGVMIVAKSDEAYHALVEAIARGAIRRRYRAIVWGDPGAPARIEAPIGRNPRNRKRMAVRPGGRPAVTEYNVLRRFDFVSEVDLTLLTGRTHQIRVHMAHIGCHVFGDPVYGGRTRRLAALSQAERARAKRALELVARQALHAFRLDLDHPVSGEPLCLEAPLPGDLAALTTFLEEQGS